MTDYILFQDLTFEKQQEIVTYYAGVIRAELEIEAMDQIQAHNKYKNCGINEVIKDIYSFEDDQDIENHIMEQAEDRAIRAFKPLTIEL